MHPALLDEVYAVRLDDRYREADHARRVANARRVGALSRRPVRARVGHALVALGEALIRPRQPRPVPGLHTR